MINYNTKIIKSKNYESHDLVIHKFGEYSSKNILIFLHGFTHNGLFFRKIAEHLIKTKKEDYLIICPDLPGRGLSSYLEKSKNYNYALYKKDLGLIFEDLSYTKREKITLTGSSMGGLIGMMFASENPNIIHKLILNDVGNFISSKEIFKIGKFVNNNIEFNSEKEVLNRIREEFSESNLSEESIEFLKSIYLRQTSNEKIKLNFDEKISDAFWRNGKQKIIPDMSFKEIWNKLIEANQDLEIQLIRGNRSKFFSEKTSKEMLKEPKVKNITNIPEVGHLPLFLETHELEIFSSLI